MKVHAKDPIKQFLIHWSCWYNKVNPITVNNHYAWIKPQEVELINTTKQREAPARRPPGGIGPPWSFLVLFYIKVKKDVLKEPIKDYMKAIGFKAKQSLPVFCPPTPLLSAAVSILLSALFQPEKWNENGETPTDYSPLTTRHSIFQSHPAVLQYHLHHLDLQDRCVAIFQ